MASARLSNFMPNSMMEQRGDLHSLLSRGKLDGSEVCIIFILYMDSGCPSCSAAGTSTVLRLILSMNNRVGLQEPIPHLRLDVCYRSGAVRDEDCVGLRCRSNFLEHICEESKACKSQKPIVRKRSRREVAGERAHRGTA